MFYLLFFVINDSLALQGSGICSINLFASNNKSFFQAFYWIINSAFNKPNSYIIVFKDKVSELIDWNLCFIAGNIYDNYQYIRKAEKS